MKLSNWQKKAKHQDHKQALKKAQGKTCKKCGACCKVLYFEKPNLSADMRAYYNYHKGVKVITYEGKTLVEVKEPCQHLTADNLCNIYNNKPHVCEVAYNQKRAGYVFPKGCAFE